jgi:hypothetical protein
MARAAQTARRYDERPAWHQRQYLDHEGNIVILGKLSEAREFNEPEGYYQYRLQVYTKVPIQPENYDSVFAYLFGITELGPFLEIYTSTQPNAFACVEHQRLEIAHRKRLYMASGEQSDSQPPLIARGLANKGSQILEPTGSCIFLTSDSYLAGYRREGGNELGTAPFAIDFSRRFPTEVRRVELECRVPNIYGDIADFVEFGNEVVSETIEMRANAPNNQSVIDQWAYAIWRSTASYTTPDGEWKIDYDADVPPPEKTAWDSQEINEILKQQPTPNNESQYLSLKWGSGSDEKTLTITNFTDSEESDLQYVIHVPFLADNTDNLSLLERTAHIFTTHILAKIGSARIRLEFQISGSSLASVLSNPNPNDLPIGALYNTKDGSKQKRLVPLQHSNVGIVPNYACEQFAVILDRPAFITEPGILFLIENMESKPEFGPSSRETIIRRSGGVTEASRRLAMLDLKEEVGWDDVRYLTADEWRSIFGVSLAQYQAAVLELELEPFEPYQPQED